MSQKKRAVPLHEVPKKTQQQLYDEKLRNLEKAREAKKRKANGRREVSASKNVLVPSITKPLPTPPPKKKSKKLPDPIEYRKNRKLDELYKEFGDEELEKELAKFKVRDDHSVAGIVDELIDSISESAAIARRKLEGVL